MNAAPEVACDAVHRLFAEDLRGGYSIAGCHRHNRADGTELYHAVRLKHAQREKIIRPIRRVGASYSFGRGDRPAAGWPLYQPPYPLIETDPLFFVEGEGCADALAKLGLTAITSGGASSAGSADLALLRGRDVTIWPDNDEPGRKHAEEVAAILRKLGCSVQLIDVAALNLPKHGDVVDWLESNPNATAADVLGLPRVGTAIPGADGASILDDVYDYIGRFVAYPSRHAQIAHTLWIAHTHLMDVWDSTPRIAFLSPEPSSGKSRALEVSELLVPRAVEAVNVTPAYLFRKVAAEEGPPTILYDEIDTVFGPKAKDNEEIRGLLNAGHRKHSVAGRCVVRGKQVFTEEIPAYCAVALAGLGGLPDTILSRCVIVRMRRRAPSEKVEPYRRRINRPAGERLQQSLVEWARSVESSLVGVFPDMPNGIADRDADVWEALIAVADAAGGVWPSLTRGAAVALVAESKQSSPSLGIQLLADLKRVFRDAEQLSTETILTCLRELDESPWSNLRGKPLDARGLSYRLRPYGIAPRNVRIGDATPKGYRRQDLHDAWLRYLPDTPAGSATTATDATVSGDVALVADVAAEADGQETFDQ